MRGETREGRYKRLNLRGAKLRGEKRATLFQELIIDFIMIFMPI